MKFMHEDRLPTVDEFLEWWESADDSYRRRQTKKLLEAQDTAYYCFLQNHTGELDYLFGRVADLEEQVRAYQQQYEGKQVVKS